jgi:1-deoxy-D-xylulose-5-phosphate reductoisomerase
MMNKGLEIIEAHFLFDLPVDRIDVVIHPQSAVHSFVEYVDGSLIAQLSKNDMRFPILYALTYPDRIPTPFGRLDVAALARLDFAEVDPRRYPAVNLAREALRAGGGMPAVLNAANEVAVDAFLTGKISFPDIVAVVAETGAAVGTVASPGSVDEAEAIDQEARRKAEALVRRSPAAPVGARVAG